jgi:hypothetical protein
MIPASDLLLPELGQEPGPDPGPELSPELGPELSPELGQEPELGREPEPELERERVDSKIIRMRSRVRNRGRNRTRHRGYRGKTASRRPISSKPSTEVFPSSEINESDKARLNQIYEDAFPSVVPGSDYVGKQGGEGSEGISVCILRIGGQIEGAAFAVKETTDTDPTVVPPESYLVHSVAISPEMRGKKYCNKVMRALVKELGDNPMYLYVRTKEGDPNEAGIKCYKRNKFRLIPCISVIKDDGPNTLMVRDPNNLKRSKKSKTNTSKGRKELGRRSRTRRKRTTNRRASRAKSRSKRSRARARRSRPVQGDDILQNRAGLTYHR